VELPLIRHGEPGSLVLVDGSVHQGFGFGASVPIAGEVVFNTGACALMGLVAPLRAGQNQAKPSKRKAKAKAECIYSRTHA
jgi:hypothetical protein